MYRTDCGDGYLHGMLGGPALPKYAQMVPGRTVPQIDPKLLAAQAESQLTLPRLVVALSPSSLQVVGVPTWLWLRSGSWAPVSSTAAVPGASVTATASPVSVSWDTGDGADPTVCRGPGTPWRPGGDPAAGSPDCGHVYERGSGSAAGEVFTVTATAHWRVGWHGAGQQGVLPDLVSRASVRVRVDEVQTVTGIPAR